MTPGSGQIEFLEEKENRKRNATYIQQFFSHLQRLNRFSRGTEDAEHFQPEQEVFLQEMVQDGYDVNRYYVHEVLVPRLAGIL